MKCYLYRWSAILHEAYTEIIPLPKGIPCEISGRVSRGSGGDRPPFVLNAAIKNFRWFFSRIFKAKFHKNKQSIVIFFIRFVQVGSLKIVDPPPFSWYLVTHPSSRSIFKKLFRCFGSWFVSPLASLPEAGCFSIRQIYRLFFNLTNLLPVLWASCCKSSRGDHIFQIRIRFPYPDQRVSNR